MSDDLAVGIRGAILKAFEENTIIEVANVKRDRRRDGDSEPAKCECTIRYCDFVINKVTIREN